MELPPVAVEILLSDGQCSSDAGVHDCQGMWCCSLHSQVDNLSLDKWRVGVGEWEWVRKGWSEWVRRGWSEWEWVRVRDGVTLRGGRRKMKRIGRGGRTQDLWLMFSGYVSCHAIFSGECVFTVVTGETKWGRGGGGN